MRSDRQLPGEWHPPVQFKLPMSRNVPAAEAMDPLITGDRLWAAASVPIKEKQADGNLKSIRRQKPDPETGEPSITRMQIAR